MLKLSAITTTTLKKMIKRKQKKTYLYLILFEPHCVRESAREFVLEARLCSSAANESICDNYADKREPVEAKLA